jgi:phosphotransferase family enzyme
MMNVNWQHARARTALDSPAGGADVPPDFASEDRALAQLGAAYPDAVRPAACNILSVWHIPRPVGSLAVVYRLVFEDCDSEIVTVRFCPIGESATAHRNARARATDPDAVLHLPDWHALGWRFPEDPGIPGLATMFDSRAVSAWLAHAAAGGLTPDEMEWSLLSYLPGQRCAVLYRFGSEAFVGKLQKGVGATHSAMRRVWSMPTRGFGMPEPVACDETLGVRWERFVAGRRIDRIADAGELAATLATVAPALAALHRSPLLDLPLRGPEELLERLRKKVLKRIAGALPALSSVGRDLAVSLAERARALPPRRLGVIHGDFHTANVLFDEDRPVFIDLDSLARGDPAYDLALFASRLLLIALRGGADLRRAAEVMESLPRLYADAGGEPVPAETFAWYMSALLVARQVKTCIRHYAPELEDTARTLLVWAGKTLQHGKFDASVVA